MYEKPRQRGNLVIAKEVAFILKGKSLSYFQIARINVYLSQLSSLISALKA